jgi:two-component system chemotaxis response regulator CheB
LSGALSDGSTGLQMIKSRGGVTIVQDPEDAMVSGMPTSALRLVNPDHVLPAREIGALLNQTGTPAERREVANMAETLEEPAEIIHQAFAAQERDQRDKQLTMYTCPDCGGTLWQTDTGPVLHFQCHVGHAWGAEALLDHKSELLEAALWTSVRMLEERATLSRQLAARIRRSSTDRRRLSAAEDEADLDEQRADAIRRLLAAPAPVMQGGATNGDHGGNSH